MNKRSFEVLPRTLLRQLKGGGQPAGPVICGSVCYFHGSICAYKCECRSYGSGNNYCMPFV